MASRREFLCSAAAVAAASALPTFAPAQTVAGKEKLIVNSYRFFDLEMPVEAISSFLTPTDLFFVRNHMAEPFALDLDSWRLQITGEVDRPLTLTYSDLLKLETHAITNTLECAGNGRALYSPHVPGIQWHRGAVGNARFAGPRLADLLQRAGLKPTAKHVAFKGLDEPPSKVPQFVRSIPIEKATHPDTLVALQMNGARLLKHHGFPARALVPGWIGAASCKWLAEIQVLAKEFDGNFMRPGYRMPNPDNPTETTSLTALNVKSVIALPESGARFRSVGTALITGAAWAGENSVRSVEVSINNGMSWTAASLGEDVKYAWRTWKLAVPLPKGEHEIIVRATDSAGRTQPETPKWNPSGYLWNGWDRVKVTVL